MPKTQENNPQISKRAQEINKALTENPPEIVVTPAILTGQPLPIDQDRLNSQKEAAKKTDPFSRYRAE